MLRINKEILKEVCERLCKYDHNIVEIVQFGSSVYATEYARDLDLLIFTLQKKEYRGYIDALKQLPFEVDIVVKKPGELLNQSFAYQVFGSCNILYGSGDYLKDAVDEIDPTFRDAHAVLKASQESLKVGLFHKDVAVKDWLIRSAFDHLSHAARIASMVYLATKRIERVGWREIPEDLPSEYHKEFKTFFETLHVRYFYNGNYPKDKVKEEFEIWHKRVTYSIEKLEMLVKRR